MNFVNNNKYDWLNNTPENLDALEELGFDEGDLPVGKDEIMEAIVSEYENGDPDNAINLAKELGIETEDLPF